MTCNRKKYDSGFTLMEVLVAIFVGILVLTGVVTTFIVQNKIASVQEGTSDMQLSGQVVLDLLGRDIRMAGYGVDSSDAFETYDDALSGDVKRVAGSDAFFVNYSTSSRHSYLYFIEDEDKVPSRLGGLTRRDETTGDTDTIAENVEDMQVTSSTDSDTGVVTVKVNLLVKSPVRDSKYTDTPPSIGGVSVSADGYRRRVFTTTVRPRNYGL